VYGMVAKRCACITSDLQVTGIDSCRLEWLRSRMMRIAFAFKYVVLIHFRVC
jgi:hypothetical protein